MNWFYRAVPTVCFLLFIFITPSNAAWEKKDVVTYFGTTDQTVTVMWDPVDNATYYEVELHHVERDSITRVGSDTLVDNNITFSLPRSGHFVPRVRACSDSIDSCSDWTLSTNSERASVDDQPRAWWLYGYIAPPGQIIINTDNGR